MFPLCGQAVIFGDRRPAIGKDFDMAFAQVNHGFNAYGQTIRKFRPRMALSTEHLPDDAYAIPHTVRTIRPDYDFEPTAASCKDQFYSVSSNVLLFQPK